MSAIEDPKQAFKLPPQQGNKPQKNIPLSLQSQCLKKQKSSVPRQRMNYPAGSIISQSSSSSSPLASTCSVYELALPTMKENLEIEEKSVNQPCDQPYIKNIEHFLSNHDKDEKQQNLHCCHTIEISDEGRMNQHDISTKKAAKNIDNQDKSHKKQQEAVYPIETCVKVVTPNLTDISKMSSSGPIENGEQKENKRDSRNSRPTEDKNLNRYSYPMTPGGDGFSLTISDSKNKTQSSNKKTSKSPAQSLPPPPPSTPQHPPSTPARTSGKPLKSNMPVEGHVSISLKKDDGKKITQFLTQKMASNLDNLSEKDKSFDSKIGASTTISSKQDTVQKPKHKLDKHNSSETGPKAKKAPSSTPLRRRSERIERSHQRSQSFRKFSLSGGGVLIFPLIYLLCFFI